MSKQTGIVKDRRYLQHGAGMGHPESPQRLAAVYDMLDTPDMAWKFIGIDARPATDEELQRVHRPGYIAAIEATAGQAMTMLDPDTIATAGTHEAARLAAGGVINAIDAVLAGEVDNAFALVRPPGHHAQPATAAGFCFFNNVAVGARHAQAGHGLERILIVDWDLHHGNGTQEIFYGDREVLYVSTHQFPAYPGTGGLQEVGEGAGRGYTLNVPLRAGARDGLYLRLFREILAPVARAYRPQLILVSAGFDTYVGDPLGEMQVTPEGFSYLTRILLDLAEGCCGGRLLLVLEGGYHVQGLTKSVRMVLQEMLGETRAPEETLARLAAGAADEQSDQLVRRVQEVFRPFWPVF